MTTFATIQLDDRSGYARSNEPVVVSVPLAESDNLTNFNSLAIRQSGTIIDAQFQVLSRWGDVTNSAAPIRCLLCIFRVASLGANGHDSTTYTLTDGGSGTASGGITVSDGGTYWEVMTGTVAGAGRFRIRKTSGGGHNVLESAEVHTGSTFKTVIATANASALYLHGVDTAADLGAHVNTQNADYASSAYTTTPFYSVTLESTGPERVVVLVTGKFGDDTGSLEPFRGMNNEGIYLGLPLVNYERSNGTSAADVSYEMRYTFWRDSAYVGLDWLIKAPEGTNFIHDAAIDHGGILIAPNFSGGSTKLFVSAHNNAGSQQGEEVTGAARIFQVVAPNGAGYTFSLNKATFVLSGATQLREALMVMQDSTNDRHVVVMHRGSVNNRPLVSPHGFWYNSTVGCISLWPTEIGEVATNYSSRTYHIFPSQMFYRWEGGLLFGNGAYSASTVRSAWKRMCNSPIVPWCGVKYQTSKALWYLRPAILTRTGETDWNEAVDRRMKWGTCVVSSGDSTDGRTIQSTYDDRNNGQFTFYWWFAYGAWVQGTTCQSNHYDQVSRLIRAWMVSGIPELWEWIERFANHMAFVCTNHAGQTYPSEQGGIMNSWTQYVADAIVEGNLHTFTSHFGLGMEVNTSMYKALMYMVTGYQPFKDACQVLINTKRGFMYNSLEKSPTGTGNFDLANTTHVRVDGLSRRFSWGVEEFLTDFLMQGDTTSLQYARNLVINILVYTDRTSVGLELSPTQTTTIGDQGGAGIAMSHSYGDLNAQNDLYTESTYTAYEQEAMIMAHDIGAWSLAHGYTAFSSGDITRLATFIKQSAKYLLIGLDKASRNNGSTAALRGLTTSPIIRGHHKAGGNNTLFGGPYHWRWGATDNGADTRSTDTATGPNYQGTCTIVGTAITLLNPAPLAGLQGSFVYADADGPSAAVRVSSHLLLQFSGTCTISGANITSLVAGSGYSLTPSLAGGWLFVTNGTGADPYEITQAIRISTHVSGSNSATLESTYLGTTGAGRTVYILGTTATLASSYVGTTGAGVAITSASGLSTHDTWSQSLNLFAYASKLFNDASDPAAASHLLSATRDLFENIYLYANATNLTNWDQPFAVGTRGTIRVGTTAFHDERIHGWHARVSSDFYLAYEAALQEIIAPITHAVFVLV